MAKQRVDVYPNRAIQRVLQPTNDVLTYAQLRFGFGVFTGSALIIHRIDWYPELAAVASLTANADNLQFALTNRDDMTALQANNMNVFALKEVTPFIVGAVVSLWLADTPWSSDFSNLPGGGLIVPSNPLFVAIDSNALARTSFVDMMMYYTVKQLTDADYVELVQSLIPVNV